MIKYITNMAISDIINTLQSNLIFIYCINVWIIKYTNLVHIHNSLLCIKECFIIFSIKYSTMSSFTTYSLNHIEVTYNTNFQISYSTVKMSDILGSNPLKML